MTAEALSIPFRITKHGEASKTTQGSNQYYAEQIATLLLTGQGERVVEPLLGMPDSAFDGFQHSSFQNQVKTYLPELTNVAASVTKVENTSQSVTVEFDIGSEF